MEALTKVQKVILDCLAEAVFGSPAVLPESPEWDAVFTEALSQSVLPLVCFSARSRFSGDISPKWEQTTYRLLSANIRSEYEHMELHKLMTAHGIPYVVLKGAASAHYYPDPALRTMGDVDFLVAEQDLPKAGAVLEEAGFAVEKDDGGAHIACTRPAPGGGRSVWEMHREPVGIPDNEAGNKARRYLADLVETAETVTLPEGAYRIPDPFHHGLVLLLHTAAHLTAEGIGLRHLCDWAVFTAAIPDGEFSELFEKPLREMGLWRFAQILTICCSRYLHSPERKWAGAAETSLTESLLADILDSGNFGRKDEDRSAQIKYIANRGDGTVDEKNPLHQVLHTIDRKTRSRYAFVSRHPALLPAGWAMTGAEYLHLLLSGRRRTGNISTLKTAKKRKQIYRQLHMFESETEE